MTFQDYYRTIRQMPFETPSRRFIRAVAKACDRDEKTVQRWLYGYNEPSDEMKRKIAGYLNEPIEELFPQIIDNEYTEDILTDTKCQVIDAIGINGTSVQRSFGSP